MKKLLLFLLVLTACQNDKMMNSQNDKVANKGVPEFFGEGSAVVNLTNHPNGYDISILKTKDLCVWHFERGDSINRYLALHGLPSNIELTSDSCSMKIDLPTKRELTGRYGDFFFMDVNFDGEPEFIVPYIGYNSIRFACFNLVDGNNNEPCIGFLTPMDQEPFTYFISGDRGETKFDYENKSIYFPPDRRCLNCNYVDFHGGESIRPSFLKSDKEGGNRPLSKYAGNAYHHIRITRRLFKTSVL